MAQSAGMLVLRSRAAELGREFGFGVVRQLVEPAPRSPIAARCGAPNPKITRAILARRR